MERLAGDKTWPDATHSFFSLLRPRWPGLALLAHEESGNARKARCHPREQRTKHRKAHAMLAFVALLASMGVLIVMDQDYSR